MLGGMLTVIVMLENDVRMFPVIVIERIFACGSQYIGICLRAHITIKDFTSITNPFCCHATPHHQGSTSVLYCLLYMVWSAYCPIFFPSVRVAIWPKDVYFCFVRKDNLLPVINSPDLMLLAPLKAVLLMLVTQK
ncbi:hypothetical protein RO3G_03770 [Rhizopus delemar RA 99-880]|uniref:Uncharacterized protein n=1 Tax=Rhizopus delemar (strain RA 99-880 / ATCC MYA-4621 / FGSC 9543 / NRRL 43880) TaxID=246409 RepID=I1BS85_RHIO9|nr:hypothetical protein RO3G_03770 [Rhizopus delemar RA 99-880]|eukprot:EIE79065.1 hypothetical protein RO3G_03770 [Rhizopus delemar RA 99-880]